GELGGWRVSDFDEAAILIVTVTPDTSDVVLYLRNAPLIEDKRSILAKGIGNADRLVAVVYQSQCVAVSVIDGEQAPPGPRCLEGKNSAIALVQLDGSVGRRNNACIASIWRKKGPCLCIVEKG